MQELNRYLYNGPVCRFGRCIAYNWKGETMATSEKKARSNLEYQFKQAANLVAGAKVTLPGRIQKEVM